MLKNQPPREQPPRVSKKKKKKKKMNKKSFKSAAVQLFSNFFSDNIITIWVYVLI